MAIIEQGTCTIDTLTAQAMGVGYSPMGKVEIPYVLPGEIITFLRHRYRHNHNCTFGDVVVPNLERQNPPCPHFGVCGGCLLQHAPPSFYHQFLQDNLDKVLTNFGLCPAIKDSILLIPHGHRRRINMDAVKKDEGVLLGFHRFKSHQIINLSHCLLVTPDIDKLINPIRDVLEEILLVRQKAKIFLTQGEETGDHNGVDFTLEIQLLHHLEPWQREKLVLFAQSHRLARLQFRHGKTWDLIHGNPVEPPYTLFDGVKVEINAYGFLQATQQSDLLLADLVSQAVHYRFGLKSPSLEIVDFFCGRGTLTYPLSRYGHVLAMDSEKNALAALEKANENAKRCITVNQRDLFTYPVPHDDLKGIDIAVINPPRAGALTQVKEIAAAGVPLVIYVSCNLETFGRDSKVLVDDGYRFARLTPIDQFIYNPHLEVVGVFVEDQ